MDRPWWRWGRWSALRVDVGHGLRAAPRLCPLLLTLLACFSAGSAAQTLARPGWRGSGLHTDHWWRDAVLLEASPADDTGATQETPLERLRARLDEVQGLGCDAILLRAAMTPHAAGGAAATESTGESTATPAMPWNDAWGPIEQIDALLADAARHRLRLLVELHGSHDTAALVSAARFWLSRGVAGLYVSDLSEEESAHMLRPVLRQFVGERVLLGDGDVARTPSVSATPAPVPRARAFAGASRQALPRRAPTRGAGADLLLVSLRGLQAAGASDDAGSQAEVARAFAGGSAATRPGAAMTVWHLGDAERPATEQQARAWLTVLLSAQGGVALRGSDLPRAPATDAGADNGSSSSATSAGAPVSQTGVTESTALLAWIGRMLALHRGNSTLRHGTPTVLLPRAEGVLVVLWRAPRGPALVEAVNLRGSAVTFSVAEELSRQHARGTFLRTVLRSDSGMGAMPLGAVSLGVYGVYVGQLSR